MPRIVVETDVRPLRLARVIDVLPLIIERLRRIGFDADGVAVLETGRREGLRLIGGTPGQAGARYRVVVQAPPAADAAPTDPRAVAAPVELEIVTDDDTGLRLAVTGAELGSTVVIDHPDRPRVARFSGRAAVPDLPSVVGGNVLDGTAELRLDGFPGGRWSTADPGPQLTVTGTLGRITGHATLRLDQGQGADGRARLDLRIQLGGVLAPLTLLWPAVRRRAIAAVRDELVTVIAGLADDLDTLVVGRDPDDIARQTTADLLSDLAVTVDT